MTTEDEFQAWLDQHPDDHTARMVFADWLDEREPPDPRAAGYRAMGQLEMCPDCIAGSWWWMSGPTNNGYMVKREWFNRMELRGKSHVFAPGFGKRPAETDPCPRREAEDALALAYRPKRVRRKRSELNRT